VVEQYWAALVVRSDNLGDRRGPTGRYRDRQDDGVVTKIVGISGCT
jgi:hypothetical protein